MTALLVRRIYDLHWKRSQNLMVKLKLQSYLLKHQGDRYIKIENIA